MQNINESSATTLRELSLDEAEMVGGGFSWGGLLHGAEHVAEKVGTTIVTAATTAATSAYVTAKWVGKEATKVAKEIPKEPTGPEPKPFGDPVDFPWFGDV
jgi:hypothetical protein